MLGGAFRVEAVEYGFHIVRRYAFAFIFHRYDRKAVGGMRGDVHDSAVGTERHGVVDEIAEDLPEPFIAPDHRRPGGQVECQG